MSVFPDPLLAAEELAAAYGEALAGVIDLSSVDIHMLANKLLAAQAEVQRKLRVFLTPTTIIPEGAPQAEIDALEAANEPYALEPAYDYEPPLFRGGSWGFFVTRQRPIVSVSSIRFAYPGQSSTLFEIPHAWIRVDRKYGHIQLVPGSQAFAAPLSAYMLQALGGGTSVPMMIQVRYRAGLQNIERDYPDLLDVIKKTCVLKILQAAFLPQSGSISADGLSESASIDVQEWHDGIEDRINDLRDAIQGVRFCVLG